MLVGELPASTADPPAEVAVQRGRVPVVEQAERPDCVRGAEVRPVVRVGASFWTP